MWKTNWSAKKIKEMHDWIFPGKELKVPYIAQINENSCGVAALEIGGAYQKWEAQKFMEFWQPTGQNVTGGIFVIIKK